MQETMPPTNKSHRSTVNILKKDRAMGALRNRMEKRRI